MPESLAGEKKEPALRNHRFALPRNPFLALLPLLFPFALVACTGGHPGVSGSVFGSSVTTANGDGPSLKAASGANLNQAPSPTINCSAEQIADFEKPEGELLDLDHEPLAKGLYLASVSQLLLEKRVDGTASEVARLMAREVAGTKIGEILCTENMEKLTTDFDMSITGLIKFDTSANPNGDSFTARQFYVFSDHNGRGVILSNPDLGARAQDLKRFLNSGVARGQFFRISDRAYLLRFVRERENARILLSIRLDLIPSGY